MSPPTPPPAARIAVLSPLAIDQIAAGEVVERPASVVKELVDNAIDAGSSRVDVELDDGGLTRISVRDNGRGIHPDDLLLAVTRHATSKLRDPSELADIGTLGFRGEALASIAAVARLDLRSRQPAAAVGVHLHARPGEPPRLAPAGMPVGTQVEIHGLFANLPARRKFMRAEATEVGQCSETVLRLAIVHPEVHFTMRHGRRELLALPRATAAERVAQVLGRRAAGPLFAFSGEEDGVVVQVWLPTPEAAARGRGGPYLIVRRRVVRERSLGQIVAQAYGLTGEATACVWVEPPRASVDVNVHPQKSEVRFSDPQRVYAAVRRVLAAAMAAAPWAGQAPVEAEARGPAYLPVGFVGAQTVREAEDDGRGPGAQGAETGPAERTGGRRGPGREDAAARAHGGERSGVEVSEGTGGRGEASGARAGGPDAWDEEMSGGTGESDARDGELSGRSGERSGGRARAGERRAGEVSGGTGGRSAAQAAGERAGGVSGGTGERGAGELSDGTGEPDADDEVFGGAGERGAGRGVDGGAGERRRGGAGWRGDEVSGGTGGRSGAQAAEGRRGDGVSGGTGAGGDEAGERHAGGVDAGLAGGTGRGDAAERAARATGYRLTTRALGADYDEHKRGVIAAAAALRPAETARTEVVRAEARGEAEEVGLFAPSQLAAPEVEEARGPAPREPSPRVTGGPDFLLCLPGPVAVFAERDALLAIDLRRLRSHLVYLRLQRDLIGRRSVAIQGLLNPAVVHRAAEEVGLIMAAQVELRTLGVDVERFGEDAVLVRGVPAHLRHCVDDADVGDLVARIVPWLRIRTREADAAAVERGLIGAIATTHGSDPAPRLARRWLGELVEAGVALGEVPGVRRWTAAALLGARPEGDGRGRPNPAGARRGDGAPA